MAINYPIKKLENVIRSLKIIRTSVDSQKDALLNLLLDMAILHLSRKLISAADGIDEPTKEATLGQIEHWNS
jgi:hypothetical protein